MLNDPQLQPALIATPRRAVHCIILAIALLACGAVTPADAQVVSDPFARPAAEPAPAEPVARARWFEPAYGLSLLPPQGATEAQQTSDDALVNFLLPDGVRMAVYLQDAGDLVQLNQARNIAIGQFKFSFPSALPIEPITRDIQPAGRPTLRVDFIVPRIDGRAEWTATFVLVKLDPARVLVFRLDLPTAALKPRYTRLFEQMLESVAITPLDRLNDVRVALVEEADAWLNDLDFDALWNRLPQDAWFRTIRNGEDVGFQRFTFTRTRDLNTDGYRLDIQSRERRTNSIFATDAEFFLARDRQEEVWSVNTWVRLIDPQAMPMAPPLTRTLLTGVDSDDTITVTLETPNGRERPLRWKRPPAAYVTQLEANVLPLALIDGRPLMAQTYAFHGASREITLRSEFIEQLEGGQFAMVTRASPQTGWRRYLFTNQGRLRQIELADGAILVPSTEDQVRQLHAQPDAPQRPRRN
ncbi:MAG: hypothetical protein AAF823_07545 [Planctomycetota bacterium]